MVSTTTSHIHISAPTRAGASIASSRRKREVDKMAHTHTCYALVSALVLVVVCICAATAATTPGVSAFVVPTSRVVSNPSRTAGAGVDMGTGTRLQLSTFGGGDGNSNFEEGYSAPNVNEASFRSTQSSTYRPLFNGGTNSVELQATGSGIGNGSGRGGFNSNSGNAQRRNQNNRSRGGGGGGVGGGLGNLFNFGSQNNRNNNRNNNFNARRPQQQQQQQRYMNAKPTTNYRNTNVNGQQRQRTGQYNTNSNQQFRNLINQPSLINNWQGGASTGRQGDAFGSSFQGAGSPTQRAGVRLSDVGKTNADREQQRRRREVERQQRAQRQRLEKQKREQRTREERERKNRRAEQQRRQREQNRANQRQNQSLVPYGRGGNSRGRSDSKLFDYDQYGRKRYSGWTAPLNLGGLFGGFGSRNGIGSGVLANSYKQNLNARNYNGYGNRNYYKYNTAASPSSSYVPNTAAALVNSAAFSAGRNSGGFNARGRRSGNGVRLSDAGKYDYSNRQGVGGSVRLSDVGKAPSFNAYDRFSNDNRALSWQDRMDRTFYRGNDISRRRLSDYDSYGVDYGSGNKNVWGGRWRGPRRDLDRRNGIIDVDFSAGGGGIFGRRSSGRRGPDVLQKFSRTIVDSGAKIRLTNEIKTLERKIKNRKSQFNAEVYDIMAEIDNEYNRYGRGSLDDREMEMMDREKDSRTRRAHDKARRDIDGVEDRIDRLREELFDLEDAMSETWDRRDDFRGDSFRRSLPPARRDNYYDLQRTPRNSDRLSLPPSDQGRIGSSRSSRYDDYERRDSPRGPVGEIGREEDRMRRQQEEEAENWRRREEEERQRRAEEEVRLMEDKRRQEEENMRFQEQRRQEEEMYRMQQAQQEEEQRMMYNNGGGEYRRDEYGRVASKPDEATWTRDDELRAVNDPYRSVDPSGRPSESGRGGGGGISGQTSTTKRVENRWQNSVGQW